MTAVIPVDGSPIAAATAADESDVVLQTAATHVDRSPTAAAIATD
jgi:hypothetical protein